MAKGKEGEMEGASRRGRKKRQIGEEGGEGWRRKWMSREGSQGASVKIHIP